MRMAVAAVLLAACGAAAPVPSAAPVDTHHGATGEIVGITSREEIESELANWRDAIAAATIDRDAAERLRSVPPGAEVDVFLGTWCGDSRREVSRLFRALDGETPLPFAIRYIGVDRAKTAPGFTENIGLRFVPTIIVRREGVELGRIIESPPPGASIERTLLGLLDGSQHGTLSGRPGL